MTSETDYHQFELKDQKRPIRPKSIKLTDDGRSRKKSKFKVIETLKNGTEKNQSTLGRAQKRELLEQPFDKLETVISADLSILPSNS